MKIKDILIAVGVIIILIVIDQLTKVIAFKNLTEGVTYKCIPGIFKVALVKNDGAAFSILSGKLWILNIITIICLFIFAYLVKYVDFKVNPLYTVALCMIIAGTIGNFIDRIIWGEVRDFLTFDFMNFAIFNFADICLTIGVILFAIDYLFGASGSIWTKNS